MIIHAISDLHGYLPVLKGGDLLIVAGDISVFGTKGEVIMFQRWIERLPYDEIVFVPGNHDQYFTHNTNPFNRVHLLIDSGVEIEGIKIWGSPYTPRFQNWYFMKDRGKMIKKHWDLIPDDTEFLITHGPPYSILDQNTRGEHCGCRDLLDRVKEVKPKYHFFGHIHEQYGRHIEEGTVFYNCSFLDEKYIPQERYHIIHKE